MGRLSIQQDFFFAGISLRKTGRGAEGWPSSPSAPSVGDKSVLSRSFHTSRSAGSGAKRKDYLCPIFIIFKKEMVMIWSECPK
jgi:hypothetical protein